MRGGCNLLKVKNLHKYYNNLHVLKGINLEVKKEEVVVIIGSSGSGKSTLLRCLNFLEEKDEGEIFFEGVKVNKAQKDIAIIFKHFNLFPHKTVIENVIEAQTIFQKKMKEKAAVEGIVLLKKVDLVDRAYVYPKNLSGGEKQRIAIARALAMNPKIMLFDEPTSSLDEADIDEVLQVLKLLAQDSVTMIIATNEVDFARDIADRIVLLEKGVIVEEGIPDDFFKHPKTKAAQNFLASIANPR